MILFDSNVLIAALFDAHPHNRASASVLNATPPALMMFAAHSIAESFSNLTRMNRPFQLTGPKAALAIDTLTSNAQIVALSAAQTLDAIRRYSAIGTGPRLYDFLIGATGEAFGADTIATWNVRDFDGLFPGLRVVTPAELMA